MILHILPRAPLPRALPGRLYQRCCLTPPRPRVVPSRRYIHHHRHTDTHSHSDWPTTTNPTPYEVLNLARDGPYTKARFYELAKRYHPDRHHCHESTHTNLSRDVCVERYRLVVLANDILSDPHKRSAYDAHGQGWGEPPISTRESYRQWRAEPGSAARNATWEDWERWHDMRSGKKQEPVYMSHGTFMALLALVIGLGVVGQANTAGALSNTRAKLMQEKQVQVIQELDRRVSSSTGMGREERVAWFMHERENAMWGFNPPKAG